MKTRYWIILLIILLATSLTACEKSASNAPIPSPTVNSSLPFPTPLPSSAISSILGVTQTAQALANPTKKAGVTTNPTGQASTAQTVEPVSPTDTNVIPTAVIVPTATPGRPATYTIHSGEYPFCIARRFNLNVADLLSINGLTMNSHPATGTVLQIPQAGVWSSGSRALIAHPATYSVNAGDTIYTVACAFGDVDPNAIVIANALKSPYTLTAGQTLNIP